MVKLLQRVLNVCGAQSRNLNSETDSLAFLSGDFGNDPIRLLTAKV